MDLGRLREDKEIQNELIRLLNENQITTVNLFGVIHHIDDLSAIETLNTVFDATTVTSLNTEDVLFIKGNRINNFYASLDRGDYVRQEDEYDALIKKTKWENVDKTWSHAGVQYVKYIHYRLNK
jgi:hypothetical protein